MTNLKERVEYAKEMNHDIIMVKNGNYVSGTWDEQTRAEKMGFEFVGTVAQLWNEINLRRFSMAAFTIFKNTETGKHVAVYDHQLPTQTGIGSNEKWAPVYHGQATGLLDKSRQRKEFEERSKKA